MIWVLAITSLILNKRKFIQLIVFIIVWSIGGFFAIWIVADSPFDQPHFIQSILIGIISGFIFYLIENSKLLRSKMMKLKQYQIVFVRVLFYCLMVSFVAAVILSIHAVTVLDSNLLNYWSNDAYKEFFTSNDFLGIIILMIALSFLINFNTEIIKMFGPGVLYKLFVGSYHLPKEEERIIMFLDLNDSTSIAERLGPIKFTAFKNDFFSAITNPILESNGEVFQYVGDEVVLTWKIKAGLKNSNWLRFFFNFKNDIYKRHIYFKNKYNFLPYFKAGAHAGIVFTSEIGELKKSIVYSGDIVNTSSRIMNECKKFNKDLLVTENLLSLTKLQDNWEKEEIKSVQLRGKSETILLYTVNQK